jgi:hypothetical protein
MKPASMKSAKKQLPPGMRNGSAGQPQDGTRKVGKHVNVVNAASHAQKLRGC